MRRELNIQLIVMSNYEIRNDNDLMLWFRIKSIQKKMDKLGPMYSKGFDWLEWESLEEDLAMYEEPVYYTDDPRSPIVWDADEEEWTSF